MAEVERDHPAPDTRRRQIVVVVDDEDIVITSIRSIIRLETDYEVVTFTSAVEALAYVSSHDVDLIVSDYLMPEMDGLAFLARCREIRPEVPRVVLTGYADKENAIKAINEIGLFQYVEKPWDNEELLKVLRSGLQKQRLMRRLHERIDEIQRAAAELREMDAEIRRTFL